MAQIFISHSARDTQLKNFFNNAFGTSPVEAKYEEIEQLYKGTVSTKDIERDITLSNAVFVLLSPTIDSLDHTRDWIGYEIGFAKGAQSGRNRDVWIFEDINDAGHLNKVIPNFDHYVVYDTSDIALKYVKSIIDSYDDGRVWRNLAMGTGGGALVAKEDRVTGAVIGGIASLIYSNLSTGRPQGIEVICGCLLKYRIHLPEHFVSYQCPNCRKFWPKPGVIPQFPSAGPVWPQNT